jgi:hypothetical protein
MKRKDEGGRAAINYRFILSTNTIKTTNTPAATRASMMVIGGRPVSGGGVVGVEGVVVGVVAGSVTTTITVSLTVLPPWSVNTTV